MPKILDEEAKFPLRGVDKIKCPNYAEILFFLLGAISAHSQYSVSEEQRSKKIKEQVSGMFYFVHKPIMMGFRPPIQKPIYFAIMDSTIGLAYLKFRKTLEERL